MATLEELRGKFQQDNTGDLVDRTHDRVFLLDVSTSMMGESMEYATAALNFFVRDGDGILVFGEEVRYVPREKLGSTALPWGLTSMLPALRKAMTFRPIEIVLITDGGPNKGGGQLEVLEYVQMISGVIVNTIGIGEFCDQSFLMKVAQATGGEMQHIDTPDKLHHAVGLLCAPSIQLAEGGM